MLGSTQSGGPAQRGHCWTADHARSWETAPPPYSGQLATGPPSPTPCRWQMTAIRASLPPVTLSMSPETTEKTENSFTRGKGCLPKGAASPEKCGAKGWWGERKQVEREREKWRKEKRRRVREDKEREKAVGRGERKIKLLDPAVSKDKLSSGF